MGQRVGCGPEQHLARWPLVDPEHTNGCSRRDGAVQPRPIERVLLPHFRHGGLLGEGVIRPQLNALWATFDDTEGRWGRRARHIEGGYWVGETFQC
jgi:hypothetical protein